jgi:hypothetical protein|nr:MAG TPA: hypothetical protein [Caudoviricetes sp.]
MSYTGHKDKHMANNENIVDFIRFDMKQDSKLFGNVPLPTREQTALVIRALRMHSLLTYASEYDYSELSKPDEVTKFWPTISSIGRFFRDAPLEVLEKYEIEHRDN